MSHGPWESETQRSEVVLWGTWDENDHVGVGYEGPNVGPCGSPGWAGLRGLARLTSVLSRGHRLVGMTSCLTTWITALLFIPSIVIKHRGLLRAVA